MSAFIEVSQLVLMRGLFEWDDMVHNGLGCMAGCCMVNFMIGKMNEKKHNNKWGDKKY